MNNPDDYRRRAAALRARYEAATAAVVQEQTVLTTARQTHADTVAAQQIAQQIAQRVQQQAHAKIAAVVARCLRTVFPDDPYEFQIVFDSKRGRTEAALQFMRAGMVLDDPLNAAGGGVVAVAAVALRISALMLSRPPLRRLLVLDETIAHLHNPDAQARFGQLLERLATDLGIQFILATGADGLRVGTVIKL